MSTNVLLLMLILAGFLVLVVHTVLKIREYGFWEAFEKSARRKGSWTASLYHFVAMAQKQRISKDETISSDIERERRIRNVYGRYVIRTGERHDPESKKKLREEAAAFAQMIKK